MKHRNRHHGEQNRPVFSPEGHRGGGGRHGPHHGRGGGHGKSRSRLFDYGEMRLLVLALIAEKPTYGYELIKTIEEKSGGSYAPSPGVIYPTLTWLEEGGYIRPADEAGRKAYSITLEGEALLAASGPALEDILSRIGRENREGAGGRRSMSMPVMRAMENLKTALRMRLRNGGLNTENEEKIAAILDDAARALGQL